MQEMCPDRSGMYRAGLPGRTKEGNQEVLSGLTLHNEASPDEISSKRDGLEKAVYRIEQAIKRSRTQGPDADRNTQHLQALLSEAQGLLPTANSPVLNLSPSSDQSGTQDPEGAQSTGHPHPPLSYTRGMSHVYPDQSARQSAQHLPVSPNGSQSFRPGLPNNAFRRPVVETESPDDNFSVDDAENPLQVSTLFPCVPSVTGSESHESVPQDQRCCIPNLEEPRY